MKIEEGDLQFLEILHDILENPLYSKILEWNQENIFEIKNIELFTSVRIFLMPIMVTSFHFPLVDCLTKIL
jgi:hypothetical protein